MISESFSQVPREIAGPMIKDFFTACEFFSYMPDPPHEVPWSCHALVRAYMELRELRVLLAWQPTDGLWGLSNHAWLEYTHSKQTVILDLYPVGSLSGPVLSLKPPKVVISLFQQRENFYNRKDLDRFDQEALVAMRLYRESRVANTNGEGP